MNAQFDGNLTLWEFVKAAGITGKGIVPNVMFDNTNFPWAKPAAAICDIYPYTLSRQKSRYIFRYRQFPNTKCGYAL
jgi:hypothetical protein